LGFLASGLVSAVAVEIAAGRRGSRPETGMSNDFRTSSLFTGRDAACYSAKSDDRCGGQGISGL
jgi:hypothetical protein